MLKLNEQTCLPLASLLMCICVDTHMLKVCVCLCGCSPEVDVWSPFQLISTLLIEVEFLSLANVCKLASWFALWIPVSTLLSQEWQPDSHIYPEYLWLLWIWTVVSMFVPRTLPWELYPQPSTCNCSMLASEIIVNVLYLPIMTTMHDNTIKIRF